MNGTQVRGLPFMTVVLAKWVPRMLEGATREKLFWFRLQAVCLSIGPSILEQLLRLCEK
jgi:hypothetical protein